MKIIDLSHPIYEQTPVFPGTPEVEVEAFATIEKDGYREKAFQLASHVGTHMDAPAHGLADGRFLDQYPVDSFMGSAIILNVPDPSTPEIPADIQAQIPVVDFIILQTGWSSKWGDQAYFKDFPYPSGKLTEAFVKRNIKGIGVDAISVDAMDSTDYPVHKVLMKNEILIIENLTNLSKIPNGIFTLCALPIKFHEADGAPVRAIAIIE